MKPTDLEPLLQPNSAPPFKEVPCNGWDELVTELHRLTRGWVFRGQLASWPLESTIERYTPPGEKDEQEARLIREFARRVDRHLAVADAPKNSLEQLALMQHFGAPTRLLDFTHSPYVAAYFAFEHVDQSPRAIWAVDMRHLRVRAGGLVRAAYKDINRQAMTLPGTSEAVEEIRNMAATFAATLGDGVNSFESSILSNRTALLIPAEPYRLSERMQVQQGTFLCLGDVRASTAQNLAAMELPPDAVLKLEVPERERPRALEELRLMNITRASLFPGLEGYAQSHRQLLFEEPSESRAIRMALLGLRSVAESTQE